MVERPFGLVDAAACDVQLERIEGAARGDRAERLLRAGEGSRDAVGRMEDRRELAESERAIVEGAVRPTEREGLPQGGVREPRLGERLARPSRVSLDRPRDADAHLDAPLELCGAADVRIDDPRMGARRLVVVLGRIRASRADRSRGGASFAPSAPPRPVGPGDACVGRPGRSRERMRMRVDVRESETSRHEAGVAGRGIEPLAPEESRECARRRAGTARGPARRKTRSPRERTSGDVTSNA